MPTPKPPTSRKRTPPNGKPPSTLSTPPHFPPPPTKTRRHPTTTLYHATASQITPHGLTTAPSARIPPHYRDLPSHGATKVLRTAEVVSNRARAPVRLQEDDWYTAHRHLVSPNAEKEAVGRWLERVNSGAAVGAPEEAGAGDGEGEGGKWSNELLQALKDRVKVGRLPDGELCGAVHRFASSFYGAIGVGAEGDWRSLDETALLAVGVLLEETVRGVLGEGGWGVFTEAGEEVEGLQREGRERRKGKEKGKGEGFDAQQRPEKMEEEVQEEMRQADGDKRADTEEPKRPRKKRRKVVVDEETWGDDW